VKAPRFLIGGDWNEPPSSTGRYSGAWIAEQTGGRITHGKAGAMGRIDYVISDAHVWNMVSHGTGGSDHDLRSFLAQRAPGVGIQRPIQVFIESTA
jgi:hypothetical protein